MGDLRSGNGGPPEENDPKNGGGQPGGSESRARAVPSHDDRYGLPDFPPDWGPVIIPDDAAELEADAARVRREQRRARRQARLRTVLGRAAPGPSKAGQPSVGVPLVIMAVAVITTLISLFVVTWGRDASDRYSGPSVGAASPAQPPNAVGAVGAKALADLSLPDANGAQVRFGTLLPAVVLLVDGCACDRLVTDLAATLPAGVALIPVGKSPPKLTGVPVNVHALGDPDGALRARLGPDNTADTTATAVLVDKSATVTATIDPVDSTDDVKPDQLAHLIP
jgi:hypothetical protein